MRNPFVMNADPIATPNRRGVKSRELVLDAAERVMAQHGRPRSRRRLFALPFAPAPAAPVREPILR